MAGALDEYTCAELVSAHQAIVNALVVRDGEVTSIGPALEERAGSACFHAAAIALNQSSEDKLCARVVVDQVLSALATRIDDVSALVVLYFDDEAVTPGVARLLARAVVGFKRREGAVPPTGSGGGSPPAARAFVAVEPRKKTEG